MFAFLAELQSERKLSNHQEAASIAGSDASSGSTMTSATGTTEPGHQQHHTGSNRQHNLVNTSAGINMIAASSGTTAAGHFHPQTVVSSSIGEQFDQLISSTQAHLSQLEDAAGTPAAASTQPKSRSVATNGSVSNTALQTESSFTIHAPIPLSASTTQTLSKPTQEVAPILVNGSSPSMSSINSSCRFERPVYAPVVNMSNGAGMYGGIADQRLTNSNNSFPQYNLQQQGHTRKPENNPMNKKPPVPNQQQQNQQMQPLMMTDADERRKQRIEKKLQEIQIQKEEPENVMQQQQPQKAFEMIDFAEKYFNHHVRDASGGSSSSSVIRTLTMTRKKRSLTSDEGQDFLLKSEMLTYNPSSTIPASHIRMTDQENSMIAVSLFKDLQKYLQGEENNMKADMEIRIIQGIMKKGIDREELRDEIFVQIMRQMSNNPSRIESMRNWILFGLATASFNPSKILNRYMQCFLKKFLRKDAAISCYAQFCIDNIMPKASSIMNMAASSCRKFPPSSLEINAVKTLSSLVCRFYFMDGRTKAIDVHPCDTAADAMNCLASKIALRSLEGWALYNHTPECEKVIKSHDFLADVIYCWEQDCLSNSTTGSKSSKEKDKLYGSIGKSASANIVTNGLNQEYKFIFKKRLFKNTREIPHDPVEVNLLYAQAVFSVVKRDEYPVSERIALQLAGLQAQISLGEYNQTVAGRYDNVAEYLCRRIRRQAAAHNNGSTKIDWCARIAEAHRMYGSGKADLIAKVWYLSVVMQYPLYGTTLFLVSYKGYHQYHLFQNQQQQQQLPNHTLMIGVNCEGILIINPNDKSILNAYRYTDIESISVYAGHADGTYVNQLITIKLNKTLDSSASGNSSKFFTFETKEKDEVANLISSYCPTLNPYNNRMTGRSGANNQSQVQSTNNAAGSVAPGGNRRLLKLSLEDRMKFHQELMNCRKILIESGRLRKAGSQDDSSGNSSAGFFSTLRKLNKKSNVSGNETLTKAAAGSLMRTGREFDSDIFKSFPHSYWAYTKFPIHNSLMVISDPEQECDSVNNFNLILTYSGLLSESQEEMDDRYSIYSAAKSEWSTSNRKEKDYIALAQRMIARVVQKESSDVFKNEFFLQLIKQTTDHPDPNSAVNMKHWQLLCLACSMTYPTDRRILSYLHAHLRKCSLDQVTEEGSFASFALKNLQGSLETRGRKVQPSRTEVQSTINRRRCYARIHFLDGQFQAVEFDACATICEVMEQIQLKIGLRQNAPGYAMYQVLGQDLMEQSIAGEEKVGDALGSWEKWHQESGSMNKQHYFIFKKHLLLDTFCDASDRIERELIFHQMVYNIRSDRFPVSDLEAIMLTALKAQIDMGDHRESVSPDQQNLYSMEQAIDYKQVMVSMLSGRLVNQISEHDVMMQHQTMRGMDAESAKNSFMNLLKSWPLHRSTIFDVQQTYTSSWPKNLWLAVDPVGIHLLEIRTRNLLSSCDFGSLIECSPSNASLMIVTSTAAVNQSQGLMQNGASSKTSKYIFLTLHAMQIATLIRDYTKVLGKEKAGKIGGRRKSVEFDLSSRGSAPHTTAAGNGMSHGMSGAAGMRQAGGMRSANPPLPPPRPSLFQRQQQMMSIAEHANTVYSNNGYNRVPQSIYGVNGPQPAAADFRNSPLPPALTQVSQSHEQAQRYSIYGQDPGFQPQPQPQQLQLHPNAQVHPQMNQQQQQLQSQRQQQGFHPTHRRQKPMSVLCRTSPVIMTDEQQV